MVYFRQNKGFESCSQKVYILWIKHFLYSIGLAALLKYLIGLAYVGGELGMLMVLGHFLGLGSASTEVS